MKALRKTLSAALVIFGIALGLDGLEVLPLFASGHRRWLVLGGLFVVCGIVGLLLSSRDKSKA